MNAGAEKDPLHGRTLAAILEELVKFYGWERLGQMIDIRCFTHDPSIASSLKFLRRTPWARARVEDVYRVMLREKPVVLTFGKRPGSAE
ncbi:MULTISPECIES: VF530 family DNA-binding protein [unclassified Paludibacterium]|uniref:VF530 family protein n=1 Tax=unclassified Paludibacterium TaxID=2618429 RepID=UPI001C04A231|nr:VF530 family protein [Paludibacterium sp. B53371]BEV71931.1 VF530 family protein [Paludibacterium sp. THUN1379]